MDTPPLSAAPPRRRRRWPWILAILLTPVVGAGWFAWSLFHLNAEARLLRDELAAATGGGWHAKVQLHASPVLLLAARAVVSRVDQVPPEARQALAAVRSACVGVYERTGDPEPHNGAAAWAEIDAKMARRGWARVVEVIDAREQVLVYLPAGRTSARPSHICLAVHDGRELVIVAGTFDPDAVTELVDRELQARRPRRS